MIKSFYGLKRPKDTEEVSLQSPELLHFFSLHSKASSKSTETIFNAQEIRNRVSCEPLTEPEWRQDPLQIPSRPIARYSPTDCGEHQATKNWVTTSRSIKHLHFFPNIDLKYCTIGTLPSTFVGHQLLSVICFQSWNTFGPSKRAKVIFALILY